MYAFRLEFSISTLRQESAMTRRKKLPGMARGPWQANCSGTTHEPSAIPPRRADPKWDTPIDTPKRAGRRRTAMNATAL